MKPVHELTTRQLALLYTAALVGASAVFMAVSWFGEWTFEPGTGTSAHVARQPVTTAHVLLALAVVIVVARIVGAAFTYLHQPAVMGEIVGGIMLGPSVLGAVSPTAYASVLPPEAQPFIGLIAQLGVVLYMFVVGLHLDLRILRTSGRATLLISHASIVVPFVFGTLLALGLYGGLAGEGARFTPFALFLGVSLSITAFPVLARILGDRNLARSELGMLALTCAAIDDVTAWCLLAFVVSVSESTLDSAYVTLGLTVAYTAVMLVVVRPILTRTLLRVDARPLNQTVLGAVFVALLLSALATELIGIHAVFGAFLLGAIIPPSSRLATEVTTGVQDFVAVMFLPAFFAFTGMRTEVGLLSTQADWMYCGLIVAVATIGKFGGAFLAALAAGLERADAAALGILMNTRGLVELIVLNIGLDIGVISPRLFTMLVVMALVTTFMTTPILDRLMRGRTWGMLPAGRGGALPPL